MKHVTLEECYFMLTLYTFLAFFVGVFVVVFYQKFCGFIIFISLFDEVLNFGNRILTNQKPELVIEIVSGIV